MGVHVSPNPESPIPFPPHPILLHCPRAPALSALLHPLNSHCSSILHMVKYMFQCYSLKSSHPRLLPHSPKVCSLHLCLFCCLAYRGHHYHLSKSHVYALIPIIILVFLFLIYFTLYNRLQFHPPH